MQALNITGRRQLMVDPRVIAEQDNCVKCMAEAKKIGRVVSLDPSLHGLGRMQYATAVWDDQLKKIRVYYCIYDKKHRCLNGLAESADGEHFEALPLDPQMLDDPAKGVVHIRKEQPDCDRMLDAVRAQNKVAMDGRCDGADWQAAPPSKNMIKTRSDEVADFGTTVRCLYDDQAVYVNVSCPGKRSLEPLGGGDSWDRQEHLEIFVDPGCTRKRYAFLMINATGQTRSEYHGDAADAFPDGWDKQWHAEVHRSDTGWSATVKLPLSMFGLTRGQTGSAWGFNVAQNVPSESADCYTRYTNWAGVWPHHQPDGFGALVFDESKFKVEHQPVWENLHAGRTSGGQRYDLSVFIDPNGPASQRYKLIWRDGGYLYACSGSDGVHFDTHRAIIDNGNLDSMNLAMWDPMRKKYVIYTRWWFRGGGKPTQRRGAARTESEHWTHGYPDRQTVMDPRKFPGNEQGYRDFYTPGVFIYENLYLALPTVFYRNLERGPLAPSLMVSPDGINFQWVGDGMPFIQRTPNDWDQGRVYFIAPAIPIGDRIYFYYVGQAFQHYEVDHSKVDDGGIGAAWIRRDGFGCYYGHTTWPGHITTAPLVFSDGRELFVNVEPTSAQGKLRVEVVGEPRFTADKCVPVTTDAMNAAVQWQGADISELRGKTIRLRFYLEGARLYAFEVK